MITRRTVSLGVLGLVASGKAAASAGRTVLILAPSNLGLRPESGREPGTWRAPEVLYRAGLMSAIGAEDLVVVPRPHYSFKPQPDTHIRNGQTLRQFSLILAKHVRAALDDGRFPVVVGGDCSILLGCLYAARRAGGQGLVHIDGHSDFVHDGEHALGSAAGMDLALATGRGEDLLTQWPHISGPLVADDDAVQIGERESFDPDYDHLYGELRQTAITRIIVQDILKQGIPATADTALARLTAQRLNRVWLHVDLDVLDQAVMPAVDSPGSPGLSLAQLQTLLSTLLHSGRIAGLDVAIYDPDRDPAAAYPKSIVETIGQAITSGLS